MQDQGPHLKNHAAFFFFLTLIYSGCIYVYTYKMPTLCVHLCGVCVYMMCVLDVCYMLMWLYVCLSMCAYMWYALCVCTPARYISRVYVYMFIWVVAEYVCCVFLCVCSQRAEEDA